MKLRIEHLHRAEESGTLTPGQATALWQDLGKQMADEPAFKLRFIVYYFGAMLMLLPFTLFVGPALLKMNDGTLLALTMFLAGGTFGIGDYLNQKGWRVAAGIFGCVAVALAPLAAFLGLKAAGVDFSHSYRDFHQLIDARWVLLELVSLAAAAGAFWRIREPFMMLPVAVVLWYLGMDLAQGASGVGSFTYHLAQRYTQIFGLAMLAGAYYLERRTKQTLRDYSFWLWIFGTLCFWGALSSERSGVEWAAAVYGLINVGMIVAGGLVGRRVLAVCGALGSAWYLWHLCDKVFTNSVAFPLVAMAIGACLVWAATQWPKFECWLSTKGRGSVPSKT